MQTVFKRLLRYFRLLAWCLGVLILDQFTKTLVVGHIEYGTYNYPKPIELIDGWLYLVHIGNTGAAWGMFDGYPLQLAAFAIVSIVCIFFFRKTLMLHQSSMQIVFGLIVGGILGNLWDRVAIGHVVDFIDVHLPFYRWPAFNIADSAICVGVVLFVVFSFMPEPKSQTLDKGLSQREVD